MRMGHCITLIAIIIVTYCSGERVNKDTASTQKASPYTQMADFIRMLVNKTVGSSPVWITMDKDRLHRITIKLSKMLKRKYRKNCINTNQQQSKECMKLILKIQDVINRSGDSVWKPDIEYKAEGMQTMSLERNESTVINISATLQKVFQEECVFASTEISEICNWLLKAITSLVMTEYLDGPNNSRQRREYINMVVCLDGYKGPNYKLTFKRYDIEKFVCCNGLVNRTSPNEECCRGNIFDITKEFCCDDHAFKYSNYTGCCGKQPYTGVDQICCGDVLFTKVHSQTECCGKGIYISDVYLCCNNKTILKESENSMCCGNQMYDRRSKTCCDENVQSAYGQRNTKGICCGKRNYAKDCYSCEMKDNEPVVHEMFDLTNQICCDGKIKDRNDYLTQCCGNNIINAETHVCKNGTEFLREITSAVLQNTTTFGGTSNTRESVFVKAPWTKYPTITTGNDLLTSIVIIAAVIGTTSVPVLIYLRYRSKTCNCIKRVKKGEPHCLNNEQERFLQQSDTDRSPLGVRGELAHASRRKNDPEQTDTISKYSKGNCSVSNFSISLQMWDGFKDDVVDDLLKDVAAIDLNKNMLQNGNDISDVLVDCGTQTGPMKECNKRTIFGYPYEHTFMLEESKRTLEIPDSVEKMTLPRTVCTNGPVEVHCTSFSSLTKLSRKFKLSDDVKIASPAAEYSVTGLSTFTEHACVTKRFIGSQADLMVWKFNSDEGMLDTIESIPVPEKTSEEQDMFYEVKGNVVYIYTKSFSGFYCTTCGHRELKLKSFLFGSYKRFKYNVLTYYEVRLMLYIADEVFTFPDYRELMREKENREGRVLKTEGNVVLLDDLHAEDRLMASVIVDVNADQWIHKLHPRKQTPMYSVYKNIALKDIAYCHSRVPDVPYSIEWYMTNAPDIIPEQTFKCVVDVNCIKKNSTNGADLGPENGATCIVLDELHLCPEDRLPLEEREDTRAIRSLIDYFTHDVKTEKQAKIINELVTNHNLGRNITVREVFTNLQKNLNCTGIYEAVVYVLQHNDFYVELDHLRSKNIIPLAFFPKPTQRVESGGHDHAQHVHEHHQQTSNNNSMEAQAAQTNAIVLNRSTPLNGICVLPSGSNGNAANFSLPRPSNDNGHMSPNTRQSHDLRLSPHGSRQNNNEICGAMGGRSVSESQLCRPEMSSRQATSFSVYNSSEVVTGEYQIPSNARP